MLRLELLGLDTDEFRFLAVDFSRVFFIGHHAASACVAEFGRRDIDRIADLTRGYLDTALQAATRIVLDVGSTFWTPRRWRHHCHSSRLTLTWTWTGTRFSLKPGLEVWAPKLASRGVMSLYSGRLPADA